MRFFPHSIVLLLTVVMRVSSLYLGYSLRVFCELKCQVRLNKANTKKTNQHGPYDSSLQLILTSIEVHCVLAFNSVELRDFLRKEKGKKKNVYISLLRHKRTRRERERERENRIVA